MNKKIVIGFLTIILFAGLFLYFRDQKQTHEANSDRAEAFEKLTEVTKRVPRAGLTQMGMAINKYYEKNNAYPEDLTDLYPEFIPLESFIEEIDWYYEPREDDFYLSKSVKRGSTKLIAFIDKELAPTMGTTATIAAVDRTSRKPEPSIDTEEFLSTAVRTPLRFIEPVLDAEKMPEVIIERPEIVSITEGEIGLGVSSEISRNVFVWRDANGTLGFGNTTYPEKLALSIYKQNAWIDIKTPVPRERASEKTGTPPVGHEKNTDGLFSAEEIGAAHSRRFLVWKDKNGVIGYGNVQGPKLKNIASVCANGTWIDIQTLRAEGDSESALAETGASSEKIVSAEGNLSAEAHTSAERPLSAEEIAASAEQIAAKYSTQYLIWKDKNGVIGYGNMQGPNLENVSSVCVNGTWIDVRKPTPVGEVSEAPGLAPGAIVEPNRSENLAARYGGKYLVWKDRNGVVGYGNVQDPGFKNMSAILAEGRWIDVEAPEPVTREASSSSRPLEEEGKDLETIASEYSSTYLIWKDKNGSIGYGNVQYPGQVGVDYICVNGNWQKVAH